MYTSMLLTQGLIPLGLLLWQGLLKSRSQVNWLLKTVMVAAYLGVVSLIGLWPVFLTWWTPYVYWIVWLLLAIVTSRSVRTAPRWAKRRSAIALFFIYGSLCGFLGSQIIQAAKGYVPPAAEVVSLTFPLKNGTYYVMNGGSESLINSHLKTLESEKFRDYRGQSYGVDIVKLNALGSRSVGLLAKEIERYEITGETVYAPCAGSVVASVKTAPDMIPPTPDRDQIPGNFVLLRCEQADVLLAHFRQEGVAVTVGDEVIIGQALGEVGNSGNTNEPHLHVHAQRPGREATPFEGDPLPVVFGDRYLVRNSRIISD